ncbi:MFS transporter [Albimonas pacifica]|uniref:Sugar phosphate permease n=1 Tax=Albimonas pacifica TaxID=1114924 RepID=A0A1I3FGB5_9RHOB|nr:MFS transporter [Albimonas pacifica]SFI10244.1 Sugar phosphate permease [Albimonas pacifica]
MPRPTEPSAAPGFALDGRASWIRLGISLLAAGVGGGAMWSIVVLLPAMEAEFGVDRGEASLAYSATMIGFALGSLGVGRSVDRFGIGPAMGVSALLAAAAYAGSAMTGDFLVLAGLQFLIGVGGAATFGPLVADISLWFGRRRGLAVAVVAAGNYLAGVIWPLVLAPLVELYGWREATWTLAAAMVLLLGPLSLLLHARVPAEAEGEAAAAAQAARRSAGFTPGGLQALLCIAGIACCLAMATPQIHVVAMCVDLGYGPTAGAGMLSLMLAGGIVSRLASGVIADRIGGAPTLLIGSVGQMISLALYLPFDGLVPLYVVSLIFGLSQGGVIPSYAIIVREMLPAREAGARVGLVIMATIFGMAAGGWMAGWIHDLSGSYKMAFLNGVAWNAVNIALISFLILKANNARTRAVAA